MALGVPSVCFRSGGLQDMIENDVTGIIGAEESVDALADAIGRFLADPDFRERSGRAARERYVREYSATRLRGRWLQLLTGMTPENQCSDEVVRKEQLKVFRQ
jgi:glycosyltransferase involved in cell wall biosynthesis